MYSHCIFCVSSLGRNEAVDGFPVGRRLAYDAAKGRLWVVCRSCERWNLTPLEERWEAIEECERHFRETRLRVSTENIGLARLREGLELVRVGKPRRPEFAGWRYGDQFGRRRQRHLLHASGGVAVVGALAAGGGVLGLGVLGTVAFGMTLYGWLETGGPNRLIATVPAENGRSLALLQQDLDQVHLLATNAGWRLTFRKGATTYEQTGEGALRTAGAVLPYLNRRGGSVGEVQRAVRELEELIDPVRVFERAARRGGTVPTSADPGRTRLAGQPLALRLAMEMAAHEEAERRALEGELAILEARWKEAEELAAIADGLTLPASVERMLRRLRGFAHR